MRKHCADEFKAKIGLESLEGASAINALSSEYVEPRTCALSRVSAMEDWHVRPLSATAIKRLVNLAGARTELLKTGLSEETSTSLSKRIPAKAQAFVASMDGTCAPVRVDCEGRRYAIDYKMAMWELSASTAICMRTTKGA
jgi:hypothetical protein